MAEGSLLSCGRPLTAYWGDLMNLTLKDLAALTPLWRGGSASQLAFQGGVCVCGVRSAEPRPWGYSQRVWDATSHM